MLTLNLLILLLGIFSSCLILWSVPLLKGKNLPLSQDLNLSIIIPARNEADNLPILLTSLSNQSFKPLEVIVVDDDSKDQTASLARQYGARVVHVPAEEKWVGKSAACWAGAKEAEGDYLLFLDADIFLADSKSLEKILSQFKKGDSAGLLSIQPYHVIEKPYENLQFLPLPFSLEKKARTVDPVTDNSTIELTVNDTLIESKGYTVSAEFLSGAADKGFPQGTYFKLSGPESTEGEKGYGLAPNAEEDIHLEIGRGEAKVLSANRTEDNQGVGTWKTTYSVGELTVTAPDELLKEGTTLVGTIKWTITEGSN